MKAACQDGANMCVQWYRAPEMGHMDAISAKDAASAIVPTMDSSIP
jgi:hypothetical protein